MALSADGNTALIGADNDGAPGAAWVFTSGRGCSPSADPSSRHRRERRRGPTSAPAWRCPADGGTALIGGAGKRQAPERRGCSRWGPVTQQGAEARPRPTRAARPPLRLERGRCPRTGARRWSAPTATTAASARRGRSPQDRSTSTGTIRNRRASAARRSTATPANVNQSFVTGIAQNFTPVGSVDRQHLYWTNGLSIARSNLDGTERQRALHQHPDCGPVPARSTTSIIYWTRRRNDRSREPRRDRRDTPIHHCRGDFRLDGLAVDSSHIYWADSTTRTIGRANLDGTGVDSSFITGSASRHGRRGRRPAHLLDERRLRGHSGRRIDRAGEPRRDGRRCELHHGRGRSRRDRGRLRPHLLGQLLRLRLPDRSGVGCTGGTIGRANLDGSEVNQASSPPMERAGPGCGTPRRSGAGRARSRSSAPTQPDCMRTSLTPAPVPPPGGAVFAAATRPGELGRERRRDPRGRELDGRWLVHRHRPGLGTR